MYNQVTQNRFKTTFLNWTFSQISGIKIITDSFFTSVVRINKSLDLSVEEKSKAHLNCDSPWQILFAYTHIYDFNIFSNVQERKKVDANNLHVYGMFSTIEYFLCWEAPVWAKYYVVLFLLPSQFNIHMKYYHNYISHRNCEH